jgi:hypothetical protein
MLDDPDELDQITLLQQYKKRFDNDEEMMNLKDIEECEDM